MKARGAQKGAFNLADVEIFLIAWWMMVFITVGLRIFPYHRVSQWTSSFRGRRQNEDSSKLEETILRIRRLTGAARRRHVLHITCLRYALTLQWLLACAGVPTQVKFGIKKVDGQFQAHAWLEWQGKPIHVSESVEKEYIPLLFPPFNAS